MLAAYKWMALHPRIVLRLVFDVARVNSTLFLWRTFAHPCETRDGQQQQDQSDSHAILLVKKIGLQPHLQQYGDGFL
jgi:hypothetical protein